MSPPDQCDGSSSNTIWHNLVEFVQASGGHVHPSLRLDGTGLCRGLIASSPISAGDLLIRLPASCVISGENLIPHLTKETAHGVSPWLLCLGEYLRAKQLCQPDGNGDNADNNNETWAPYFQSLPATNEYETIFQWTLEEIKTFLKGTTLGRILEADRTGRCTEEQFRLRVEPFLNNLGLVDQAKESNPILSSSTSIAESPAYQSFLDASMCIATRGFHLMTYHDIVVDSSSQRNNTHVDVKDPGRSTYNGPFLDSPSQRNNTHEDVKDPGRSNYNGPFLLPVIDLLNHDPPNSCTTLQRDPTTGSFWMVAERSLSTGDDVVHSYGNDLTSAQLLQTFGFVPLSHTQDVCISRQYRNHSGLTPAYLRKTDHLLTACQKVKSSSYPKYLRDTLIQQKQSEEEDYFWDVQEIPGRLMEDSMPEEFFLSISSNDDQSDTNHNFLLSEEIITFVVVQFLPEDAYLDIFGDDTGNCGEKATLDRSILTTDYYIRELLCRSMIIAIDQKVNEYAIHVSDPSLEQPIDVNADIHLSVDSLAEVVTSTPRTNHLEEIWKADQHRLKELLTKQQSRFIQEEREKYGRTIRLEELTNLKTLSKEVEELMSLSADCSSSDVEQDDPPLKRSKRD